MYAFEFHKPTSLAEASALIAGNADGKFLSGGHTLLPAMKLRLAAPSALVDLTASRRCAASAATATSS
jgi:carbon-monoxide dehydrogenase medium subunit